MACVCRAADELACWPEGSSLRAYTRTPLPRRAPIPLVLAYDVHYVLRICCHLHRRPEAWDGYVDLVEEV